MSLSCHDEVIRALRDGDLAALDDLATRLTDFPDGTDPVTGLDWASLARDIATPEARAWLHARTGDGAET